MRMIRTLVPADVDAIAAFALKAMPAQPQRASADKVFAWVDHMVRVPGHFKEAAFDDDSGAPLAATALYVSEMPFHARCEGHVVFCYSEAPGEGARLLRRMLHWVRADIRIQRVLWTQNEGSDLRIPMLARRLGFASETTNLLWHRALGQHEGASPCQ